MIEKPTIIITSLGRTGTLFFTALFKEIIPDGTSLHEPDYLNFGQYRGTRERIRQVIRQLHESGVSNLIVKKYLLGRWNLLKLSDARLRRKLGYDEAVQQVLSQRRGFVHSRKGSVYIESSAAYRGLVDVLKDVYQHHRAIYIIRDGRDWVQSMINFSILYNHGRIRGLVHHPGPTPMDIENDPYQSKWKTMSRFEKLCWAWVRLNSYALGTVQQNPNARIFRFEDIFKSKNKYQHLEDLVRFATSLPGVESGVSFSLEGWLDRKIHKSIVKFPAWPEWSLEHKQQFRAICTPLMTELDYEI